MSSEWHFSTSYVRAHRNTTTAVGAASDKSDAIGLLRFGTKNREFFASFMKMFESHVTGAGPVRAVSRPVTRQNCFDTLTRSPVQDCGAAAPAHTNIFNVEISCPYPRVLPLAPARICLRRRPCQAQCQAHDIHVWGRQMRGYIIIMRADGLTEYDA